LPQHGWAPFEIQISLECLDASLPMMNRCHSMWLHLITCECKNIKLDIHLHIELSTVYVCILAVGPYARVYTVLTGGLY